MSRNKPVNAFENVSGIDFGLDVAQLTGIKAQAQHQLLRTEDIHVEEGHNPRGSFDRDAFSPERLEGLAQSIREDGLLTPLWVRPRAAGGWSLIAGERRLRAAALAGVTALPVLIMQATPVQAARLALLENAQREQMNVVEETFAGFLLMEQHTGLSRSDLVTHLNAIRRKREDDMYGLEGFLRGTFGSGVQTWAQLRSKVLDLTDRERSAIFAQEIDYTVALPLVRLAPGNTRSRLLERAITEQLSALQVSTLVKAELGVSRSELQQAAEDARKWLPRLGKLEGGRAEQARALLQQLRALTEEVG